MMKRKIIIMTNIIFFLLIPSIVSAGGVDVRGRINGMNPYSHAPYPLGGITVDLYFMSNYGWQYISKYITGPDGMYYFKNISPGYYTIQINGRQNYSIRILDRRYQDLPPIIIRY